MITATSKETAFWNKVKAEIFPSSVVRQFSLSSSRQLISPCIEEMMRLLNKGKRSNYYILRKTVEEDGKKKVIKVEVKR